MNLTIFHYHLRPGGVRKLMEIALRGISTNFQVKFDRVTVLTGESSPDGFESQLQELLPDQKVHWIVNPCMSYLSELTEDAKSIASGITSTFDEILHEDPSNPHVIWAHNPSLGRNWLVSESLQKLANKGAARVVFHHHDWWFDNRWFRWEDHVNSGFNEISKLGRICFPAYGQYQHVAINSSDSDILTKHFVNKGHWLPNPIEVPEAPSLVELNQTKRWLSDLLGNDQPKFWLMSCRVLRRKNILEALLLARWLQPEATLLITGPPSSQDEMLYTQNIERLAQFNRWRLRWGIVSNSRGWIPRIATLAKLAEINIFTSMQEGFGLPYLEAALGRVPFINRRLDNIAPDFQAFGIRFPQEYGDLLVPPVLFDWEREKDLQWSRFQSLRSMMPQSVSAIIPPPAMLEYELPTPVPFSSLTPEAQLEVIEVNPCNSYEQASSYNPFLEEWKTRLDQKVIEAPNWPQELSDLLSPHNYVSRLARIMGDNSLPVSEACPDLILGDFLAKYVKIQSRYPSLWVRGKP